VRVFNPLALSRLAIRDHRKLVVCDEQVAFVGGSISRLNMKRRRYARVADLGLQLEGPLAVELAVAFDEMFARAEFRHKRPLRWRRSGRRHQVISAVSNCCWEGRASA